MHLLALEMKMVQYLNESCFKFKFLFPVVTGSGNVPAHGKQEECEPSFLISVVPKGETIK